MIWLLANGILRNANMCCSKSSRSSSSNSSSSSKLQRVITWTSIISVIIAFTHFPFYFISVIALCFHRDISTFQQVTSMTTGSKRHVDITGSLHNMQFLIRFHVRPDRSHHSCMVTTLLGGGVAGRFQMIPETIMVIFHLINYYRYFPSAQSKLLQIFDDNWSKFAKKKYEHP